MAGFTRKVFKTIRILITTLLQLQLRVPGYNPPPLWTGKQTENITFRHTTCAGSTYINTHTVILIQIVISDIRQRSLRLLGFTRRTDHLLRGSLQGESDRHGIARNGASTQKYSRKCQPICYRSFTYSSYCNSKGQCEDLVYLAWGCSLQESYICVC